VERFRSSVFFTEKFAPWGARVYWSNMDDLPPPTTPLVRCGGCGAPPDAGHLRRGRCARCYDTWVRARPIGLGAVCAACEDRRRDHLRHYELGVKANAPGGRWVVLCFTCVARADEMVPPPRSIEGLKMRLARDRRYGDRRAAAVGRPSYRDPSIDRREGDRRDGVRDLFDASELVDEIVVGLEAEPDEPEEELTFDEPLTRIHIRPDGV
jgi:hypothetical protein